MAQSAELHLWRAVLALGLRDATAGGRAAFWIKSRDFVAVCHLAQVEPEAVRRSLARHPERFTGDPRRAA